MTTTYRTQFEINELASTIPGGCTEGEAFCLGIAIGIWDEMAAGARPDFLDVQVVGHANGFAEIEALVLTMACEKCDIDMYLVDTKAADIYITFQETSGAVLDTDSWHFNDLCTSCHDDVTSGCTHISGDAWSVTEAVGPNISKVAQR